MKTRATWVGAATSILLAVQAAAGHVDAQAEASLQAATAATQELLARAISATSGTSVELLALGVAAQADQPEVPADAHVGAPQGPGRRLWETRCAWTGAACTLDPTLAPAVAMELPMGSALRGLLLDLAVCRSHSEGESCAADLKCTWQAAATTCELSGGQGGALLSALAPTASCGWTAALLRHAGSCAAQAPGRCFAPYAPGCLPKPAIKPAAAGGICGLTESCESTPDAVATLLCGASFNLAGTVFDCIGSTTPWGAPPDSVAVAQCVGRTCPDLGDLLGAVASADQACAPQVTPEGCARAAGCQWNGAGPWGTCGATRAAVVRGVMQAAPSGCPLQAVAHAAADCDGLAGTACSGACAWKPAQACVAIGSPVQPLCGARDSAVADGLEALPGADQEATVLAGLLRGLERCRAAGTEAACGLVTSGKVAPLFP